MVEQMRYASFLQLTKGSLHTACWCSYQSSVFHQWKHPQTYVWKFRLKLTFQRNVYIFDIVSFWRYHIINVFCTFRDLFHFYSCSDLSEIRIYQKWVISRWFDTRVSSSDIRKNIRFQPCKIFMQLFLKHIK